MATIGIGDALSSAWNWTTTELFAPLGFGIPAILQGTGIQPDATAPGLSNWDGSDDTLGAVVDDMEDDANASPSVSFNGWFWAIVLVAVLALVFLILKEWREI